MQALHDLGDFWNDLYGSGAGSNDADTFIRQVYMVVPAGRMEGLTFKCLHPINSSQSRRCQDAVGEDHVLCLHGITAIGGDSPSL